MVGGCQKKEPGAGMDSSLGLVKVYKDGYFHLRCMWTMVGGCQKKEPGAGM